MNTRYVLVRYAKTDSFVDSKLEIVEDAQVLVPVNDAHLKVKQEVCVKIKGRAFPAFVMLISTEKAALEFCRKFAETDNWFLKNVQQRSTSAASTSGLQRIKRERDKEDEFIDVNSESSSTSTIVFDQDNVFSEKKIKLEDVISDAPTDKASTSDETDSMATTLLEKRYKKTYLKKQSLYVRCLLKSHKRRLFHGGIAK